MPTSLNEIIPALSRETGKVIFAGRERTEQKWSDVRGSIEVVAARLEAAGVRSGDNVGLLAANSYEWLLVDLACLLLGSVSVPFDVRREWEIDRIVAEYDLALLVTDVAGASGPKVLSINSLHSARDAQSCAPHRFLPHRFSPHDPYTVKFSSGTTAQPKALKTRVLHFDHMAEHVLSEFPLDASDHYLLLMPLSIYLQRFFVHLSILAGASVTVGPMEQAPRLLQSSQPTVLIGVPQLLKSLLAVYHRQREKNPEIASLRGLFGRRMRYLWTGTAPIDQATLLEFDQEGIPVYEGYGMSETGLIAKNYPGARRVGSVGKPFPGKSIELGPAGEVIVRSAYHTSEGYWRGEDEGVFLGNGCIATGDVGRLDVDGFLYLVGRTKDAIVLSSGYKVFPSTVEERLLASGPIKECLVYGQGQSYLTALIVPAKESVIDEQLTEAMARANSGAPVHEQVLAFLRVPDGQNALRNTVGKLDRRSAHVRYGEQLERLYTQNKQSKNAIKV
jgi:long-subunit acyl-CoA synthetase (AMP-forming)